MANYSVTMMFNICLYIGVTIIIFEFFTIFLKVEGDIFNSSIKFIFYFLLASVMYYLALKSGNEINSPNSYLNLLTFALAVFEAIQNLFVLIKKFILR